jgi:L-fuconolactonase
MTEPLAALRRDFLPGDLQPLLQRAGLDGCIAVQAQQTVAEARWLLELARQHPFIRGVVGWVDLRSERVEESLSELSREPAFVGVRHVVQDEPDNGFLLLPDFQRGIGRLREFDLTYDLLIYPRQLPAAVQLVRRFPEQAFVLDHIAKPPIRDGGLSPWREQIRELARSLNVFCKVSGMVTEAKWQGWSRDDFRPYLDVVLEAFGPERLMFGSDWPVCTLAGQYEQVFELVDDFTRSLTPTQRAGIFGDNAAAFYGINSKT